MTTPAPKTAISVSIRADLAAILEAEAEARVVGKALLVEKALEAYLPNLPKLTTEQASSYVGSNPGFPANLEDK